MSKQRTLYLIILAAGLLSLILVSTTGWNFTSAAKSQFRGKLEGDKVVPPVKSSATGVIKFKIKNDTISYDLNASGLADATGAQIHKGGAGKVGDTIVDLFKAGKLSKTPNGIVIVGKINASNLVGPLAGNKTSDLVSALSTNKTYVQIQTTAHPDGEIRGQIRERISNTTSEGIATASNSTAGTPKSFNTTSVPLTS